MAIQVGLDDPVSTGRAIRRQFEQIASCKATRFHSHDELPVFNASMLTNSATRNNVVTELQDDSPLALPNRHRRVTAKS